MNWIQKLDVPFETGDITSALLMPDYIHTIFIINILLHFHDDFSYRFGK